MTSQIFSNIYLNEFDRYVVHTLRPLRYARYGDDMVLFGTTRADVERYRTGAICVLKTVLGLDVHRTNDILLPVRRGIHYLGVDIFPTGRILLPRSAERCHVRLTHMNLGSYYGLVHGHANKKRQKQFDWHILQHLDL